jgi:hypothetical protein
MREKAKGTQVHYDPQSDILYFLVRDGEEERFVEVAEGVNLTELTARPHAGVLRHPSDDARRSGRHWNSPPCENVIPLPKST